MDDDRRHNEDQNVSTTLEIFGDSFLGVITKFFLHFGNCLSTEASEPTYTLKIC